MSQRVLWAIAVLAGTAYMGLLVLLLTNGYRS